MNWGWISWKVCGFALELLAQPADGGLLVADEEFELDELARVEASGVVLGDLLPQEEHAVALGGSAGGGRRGNRRRRAGR